MTHRATEKSPRWRRRKEERPAEIIAAALETFAERGFAATRLDDIAERAGVTRGTLYLYFPSKEELFKAVVRQAIVPVIARGDAGAFAGVVGGAAHENPADDTDGGGGFSGVGDSQADDLGGPQLPGSGA